MSLDLILLLAGSALLAGASVSFRNSEAVISRSVSAAAFTLGYLAFLIGLVNALSGTT